MASKLKFDGIPSHQQIVGVKSGSLGELRAPVNYPPFLALQLVFRDYLQEEFSLPFFRRCRLASKQFKYAAEASHPPYTWHINGDLLNKRLQTVVRFITSEPRWEWVTKVRLSGAGVSMTQRDCKLLVSALGGRAWESISLVEVKLTHPLMLPAIIKTSAERGTLRHLSISDSRVSSAGLQSALSALDHCLQTLELSPGITFFAPSERPLVAGNHTCKSVRTLLLGDAHEAREARELMERSDQPTVPGRLPVASFTLEPLRTLWLIGLGGLTEADVIDIFRRTPLLEEFRLFSSGSRVTYSDDAAGVRVAAGRGSHPSLTPAAVAGVVKGLTRHPCPRLARISIGWKHYPVGNQELTGPCLRRFADAHPGMKEIKLFLTGSFPFEDWLYALEKWAPTLKKVTGLFGENAGDLDAERQMVLFAKAPRLTELECLGECNREGIQWIRYQCPGAFAELKHVGDSEVRRVRWNKFKGLMDQLRSWRTQRE